MIIQAYLNWTNDLTLFTNGASNIINRADRKLEEHHIKIVEKKVERLEHINGYLNISFSATAPKSGVKGKYAHSALEQHCQFRNRWMRIN